VIEYTLPDSGGALEQRLRCSLIASEIVRCLCSTLWFQGICTYTATAQWGHIKRASFAFHGLCAVSLTWMDNYGHP